MAKSTLTTPSRNLASIVLISKLLTGKLYRISRHNTGEPFFGKSGSYRFDDPTRTTGNRYGVCYAGLDLETAIAETLLHDQEPMANACFAVAKSEIDSRYFVELSIKKELNLVDMTGIQLKTLAGGGELSTVTPYGIPQKWSKALHLHPGAFDGIYYMSRHLNDRPAVALFDRVQGNFGPPKYTPLRSAPGVLDALMKLRVQISY